MIPPHRWMLSCVLLIFLLVRPAEARCLTNDLVQVSKPILSSAVLAKGAHSVLNKDNDDELEGALMEIYGHKVMTLGTLAISNTVFKQSVDNSIAYAYGVGALGVMSMIVQKYPSRFGFTVPGLIVEFFVHVLAALLLLFPGMLPSFNSNKVVLGIACFGLVNGVMGLTVPSKFASVWGLSEGDCEKKSIQTLTRKVALAICASCITTILLLRGSTDDAILYGCLGYAALAAFIH